MNLENLQKLVGKVVLCSYTKPPFKGRLINADLWDRDYSPLGTYKGKETMVFVEPLKPLDAFFGSALGAHCSGSFIHKLKQNK